MLMQRFLEVANGIPRLVIVTLLLLVLKPGMLTIIFALMLTEWVGMSRIARAEMLKLKEQEFVLASRTLGANSFFIIFKEVLPNIIGPIITQVMFSIPTAIFTEAFLSFVGLGIPVPQCSLGSLISDGFNSFTTHSYQIIPPRRLLRQRRRNGRWCLREHAAVRHRLQGIGSSLSRKRAPPFRRTPRRSAPRRRPRRR